MLIHPFKIPGSAPELRVSRGHGCTMVDENGRSYVDAAGGLWNLSLGLGQERIIAAMQRQAEQMAYCGLFDTRHSPAEALAERLVSLSDGLFAAAYFSTTGTSAVECALRLARTYQKAKYGRFKGTILNLAGSYHGCSWMNLSASESMVAEMEGWEESLPGFKTIPGPSDEEASLTALEQAINDSPEDVACLIMEPIQGTGGVIVPSRSYMEGVQSICRAADVLIIADEVATGCGRTGRMFTSPALGLEPDIVTLAKGLTAGYFPLGATLVSDRVVSTLRSAGAPTLFGSTQDGNPIGCAVALEVIDMIADEGLCDRASEVGDWFRDGLSHLVGTCALSEIRGMGAMLGLALVHPFDGQPYSEAEAAGVRRLCQEEGLLVYHFAEGISLFPALSMDREEAEDAIDMLSAVLPTLS